MERKMTILKLFFEDPNKKYSIRELSRILKINHTTVRKYLNDLATEGFLSLKKEGVYSFYKLVLDKKTLNLKLYYNLEKLRKSKIIADLEKEYDLPVIVLFGSYASAMDDSTSDIDLCIISNIEKDFSAEKYEKKLNRRVSIHKFDKTTWEKAKKSNPELINNICNGTVLSGELTVL
ncbi:ArsR family transcriptional regulator [Candidatus Woesearchaeota archaeon]|nr:ArsR family transcriptional regulator [Candidatus Woesearchaeota archaeon]